MNIKALVISFFCFSHLFSQIYEIEHVEEIFKYITPETLVIFDVDDTLITSPHHLGREEWFHTRVRLLQEEGKSLEDARARAFHEWHGFQHVSEMQPVEKQTALVVKRLQEDHYVMSLTARDPTLFYSTTYQFRACGISFRESAPLQEALHLSISPKWSVYQEGIIFTSGGSKGKALFTFLDQIDFKPKEIVFVDDREHPLIEVEEYALEREIPFTGLRYGYLDEKRTTFDHQIASVQHEHFFKILSDEEAKKIVIESSQSQHD